MMNYMNSHSFGSEFDINLNQVHYPNFQDACIQTFIAGSRIQGGTKTEGGTTCPKRFSRNYSKVEQYFRDFPI